MKKRLISLLLAFSMMLTFLPAGAVSAFAEEKIDSSTEILIPNDYTGSVYTITEENATYQMKGNYNFPIKITAKGVTINIIGNITYGFEVHEGDIPYLIDVETTGGVTINNYVIERRITRAKQLLRFTDKTIDEIGVMVGMDSANYFSRVFRKIEGISPGEYRKQW